MRAEHPSRERVRCAGASTNRSRKAPADPYSRTGRRELFLLLKNRIIITGLALLTIFVIASACSNKKPVTNQSRTFTDELGRTIQVAPDPRRIVSLAPSVTETLFALGLGDRVVGVTSFCDHPFEATQKEKVGDTQRPNLEKIIAARPDLVIVSTASELEQFVQRLDQLRIPVYVSNPRNVQGVLDSIMQIGELTGVEDRARELAAGLEARIARVDEQVAGRARPRVLFIIGTSPLFTVGGTGFINDLIERAGGVSVTADEKSEFPQFSLETAIARQPEVIFLQSGDEKLPNQFRQTPAALAGRVFTLDSNVLLRPGPRIVEGLEHMAERLDLK